eukprot:14580555-Heterocapsa_arctica.AAC.1
MLTSSDPAERTKKLAAEIADGRLAMMAIVGIFFLDGLAGSAWDDLAAISDCETSQDQSPGTAAAPGHSGLM